MTKSQEIKRFLEDYISLCEKLMYATQDAEFYELVKTSIREFKAKHKGIWARAFIELLRDDVERDIAAESDVCSGPGGEVWVTMNKIQIMVDRYWREDAI